MARKMSKAARKHLLSVVESYEFGVMMECATLLRRHIGMLHISARDVAPGLYVFEGELRCTQPGMTARILRLS